MKKVAIALYFYCVWLGAAHSDVAAIAKSIPCESLLVSQELESARVRLKAAMDHIPENIENLKISSANVVPLSALGAGSEGIVFKVKMNNKIYALKLSWRYSLNKKDAREPILIQKNLGEIDIAPKLIGVLDKSTAHAWLNQYSALIHSLINNNPEISQTRPAELRSIEYGILMELTETLTLRYVDLLVEFGFSLPPLLPVSEVTFKKLVNQSEQYMKALNYLGIIPRDMDGIVSDKGLLLIDVSNYGYRPDQSSDTWKSNHKKMRDFLNVYREQSIKDK